MANNLSNDFMVLEDASAPLYEARAYLGAFMKLLATTLFGAAMALTSVAAIADPGVTRTVQLSKVVLDTETSELTARVKGGTLCVFPSNVKVPKEKKTQDYERFDNLFTGQLKTRGISVVSTSSDMFGDADDKNKGDYLVGVVLRPSAMNLCSSVSGEKGDVAITAEWQIYDRSVGKIVETVTTSGQGVQAKFAADGQKQMFNEAFVANLSALLQKGVLQKYVQAPATQ